MLHLDSYIGSSSMAKLSGVDRNKASPIYQLVADGRWNQPAGKNSYAIENRLLHG